MGDIRADMPDIPGARAKPLTSQLLVSSGVPTLDKLLGGGLPVGSITLIEEDEHGSFAKTLLKYFIVEAIASKQHTLTISLDGDPNEMLKNLPALSKNQPTSTPKTESYERMKIAFRYENLPTKAKEEIEQVFGHYYDLSEYMPEEDIDRNCHVCLSENDIHTQHIGMSKKELFKSKAFNKVIHEVNRLIKDTRFSINEDGDNNNSKTILRICIHQLGTIMWDDLIELPKFLYYLRCMLRKCFAIAMVTVPTHLSDKLKRVYDSRLINSADIALRLVSFSGTHYAKNKALSDFHGFFYVDKLAAINCLKSTHPGPVEFTFKLLRKKFCIEKFHLPAGIDLDPKDDKMKRRQAPAGCGRSGGGGSSALDF